MCGGDGDDGDGDGDNDGDCDGNNDDGDVMMMMMMVSRTRSVIGGNGPGALSGASFGFPPPPISKKPVSGGSWRGADILVP